MRLTIRYLLDKYGWDKCIDVFGWNEWMLAEGRALETDYQSVTEAELRQLEGLPALVTTDLLIEAKARVAEIAHGLNIEETTLDGVPTHWERRLKARVYDLLSLLGDNGL